MAGLPTTPETLLAQFDALGIEYLNVKHAPVFTVEEAKQHRTEEMVGACLKNLFVVDRKKRMYLLVLLEDRAVNLKEVAAMLETKDLRFGSPDRLMERMGVIPGSVSPFCAVNDLEDKVTVYLDEGMKAYSHMLAHPLSNDQTTRMSIDDLVRYLDSVGHSPKWLVFPDAAAAADA